MYLVFVAGIAPLALLGLVLWIDERRMK